MPQPQEQNVGSRLFLVYCLCHAEGQFFNLQYTSTIYDAKHAQPTYFFVDRHQSLHWNLEDTHG
jgi:hypothetical protein